MALVGVVGSSAQAPVRANTAWLSYGHDGQLTNYVRSPMLNATTAPHIHLLWATKLDGSIVASPLYAPARLVTGARVDLVFVETEAGSIYALLARSGAIVWQRNFGSLSTDCGTWGFTSTGAIDLRRGLIYAISADGELHALALETGDEAPGWPFAVSAARNQYEYVWGGLRIVGGRLYVGVAAYCDEPDPANLFAEGRLLSISLDDPANVKTFDPVPGYGNGGGVWSWGGVSVEPDGSALYTGVGNSYVLDPTCACYVDTAGYGERMLKLTPDFLVIDSDRPPDVPNTGDDDFGSAPVLFQPPGCRPYAAANNKLGLLYIWNRDLLGHGPIMKFGLGDGIAAFVGAPSYSPDLHTLFEGHSMVFRNGQHLGEGVSAVSVDRKCHFHLGWTTQTGDGNQPAPLLVNSLVFAADGDPGGYTILNAKNGRRLWSFSTNGVATISPAIAAKDVIIAGDASGVLRAFGR